MAHVGTEDHSFRTELLQPTHKQVGIRDGHRTYGHQRSSGCKSLLDVLVGLDAAAEVHRQTCRGGNRLQYVLVHDVLRLRTIEIDYMQTQETYALELKCHIQRFAIDRLLVVVTLGQPHALTVDDIYGWNQFYFHPNEVIIYKL